MIVFGDFILIFTALNVFLHVGNGNGNVFKLIVKTFGVTYLERNCDAHQMFNCGRHMFTQMYYKKEKITY